MTILYMIISNTNSPSFGEFGFYYNTNVRHISKTTIGFLDTLGSFSNLAGVIFYSWWFTNVEYRSMLLWGTYIGFVGSVLCIGFILEYNKQIGISDEVYLYVTTVVFSAVYVCFTMLPMAILFVKITPKSIEGTIYAIFIGTQNMAGTIISPLIGSWINDNFLKVTRKSMLKKGDEGYLWMNIL